MKTAENDPATEYDVLLIGAGIMSATLGILLKSLEPDLRIGVFEKLDRIAAESTDAWNNAGTGHSAFCELNYTPERPDGSIDLSKALKIVEAFEVSKQFWAWLTEQGRVGAPDSFIADIPHMSLVWGAENVAFLRKRFEALQGSHFFKGMVYSEDRAQLHDWMPIVMEGRSEAEPLAATRIEIGTDVNFGALTRQIFAWLQNSPGVDIVLNREVERLDQLDDGRWQLRIEDEITGQDTFVRASFVFIGAGGGSLPLLDKSDIEEGKGFGGFPVSGQWLICKNPDLIARHEAKVYGKAAVGAPPMSVPHLDTRIIGQEKSLLFGPYAGFTTKFLKEGSVFDLPLSVSLDNLRAMIGAWWHNLPLTGYLLGQVTQSEEDRMEALREFVPTARPEDWELARAGQRVQVIKKDQEMGGVLEFGTEMVVSADGSIAALLGASPGASTAVSIMLDLLKKCFSAKMQSPEWQQKLAEMIPSYGHRLADDPALTERIRAWTHQTLGLNDE